TLSDTGGRFSQFSSAAASNSETGVRVRRGAACTTHTAGHDERSLGTLSLASGRCEAAWRADGSGFIAAMKVDASGNVLVAGRSCAAEDYDKYYGYYFCLAYEVYLTKYSPAGALVWTQTYGFPFLLDPRLRAIAIDSANNIYVAGA